MVKKLALGKGMASLLGNVSVDEAASYPYVPNLPQEQSSSLENFGPTLIDISQIKTNPNQPRKIFKEKELNELAESIKENGVLQPLLVAKTEEGFELVAGERRLRASILAGLEKVPVVIKHITDREKMIMSIIENVQRSDLNCVEEALAYYQLMEEFKLTQEEVAKKLGKERSTIANFLRVLRLPRPVIDLLQKEILSFGHAKILAAIEDREEAIRFANQVATEQLSVRELENLVSAKKKTKKASQRNPFFDDKLVQFRQKLEQKTGFHFAINSKPNGAGQITIKFNNEAEFNDVYEFLLTRN